MEIHRRMALHLAVSAVTLAVGLGVAGALDYPTRPVHLVVGFAAGGPLDMGARLIGNWLSGRLHQPFIIEDRPGGSGNRAAEDVVRSSPDGYVLLECASPNSFNMTLYQHLGFNFLRDIAPVAGVSRVGGVMEVSPTLPVSSVPEFLAYAKAHPGSIKMASAGPGSSPGLWGALFQAMTGITLTTVQYSGSGPALIDLISGRVQVMFDVASTAIAPVEAGKVRALAVTTAKRMPQLPAVPAMAEFVPGYEAVTWQGIGAPKNTPPRVIAILNGAINAALADAAFKARLFDLASEPFATTPAEFGEFIVNYTSKWATVIRQAHITLN